MGMMTVGTDQMRGTVVCMDIMITNLSLHYQQIFPLPHPVPVLIGVVYLAAQQCSFYQSGMVEGVIQSENYGIGPYPGNRTCVWTLEGPVGSQILIQVIMMQAVHIPKHNTVSTCMSTGRLLSRHM